MRRMRQLSWVGLGLVGCLGLLACGDGASSGDALDTGDTGDTSDTGTPDTQPDASEVIDDGSLDGTFLEATAVTWDEALTLCSVWREGASIGDELAHKVRMTIEERPRAGLSRAALEAATLGAVEVQTSPLSAGRHRPTASSAVESWTLLRYESYDTVLATVSHTLGEVGVLEERYSVARDGATDPAVVVAGDGSEVTFWWKPTGAGEAFMLGPCEAPESWERAVEVVAVERGGEHTTLLRYYRTPWSEITAGSYPVHLEATTVHLGSEGAWPVTARGFWAHTYAAQHHNWNDDTVVDFARDLGGWQMVFGPLAGGVKPRFESISKIEYLDVRGDDAGEVAVSHIGTDGEVTRATWRVVAGPERVDAHEVRREFDHLCATPTVGVVGYGDHMAQLVFCPSTGGAAGKALVGVVPVVWKGAAEEVGARFSGAAIVALSGRPGWVVEVGVTKLVVEPQADDNYLVDVLDAQGQSLAQMWSPLMELEPAAGWQAPVRAASGDGEVELAIDREWVVQGVGHSAIYACPRVSLRWGERLDVVEAWDAIDYENTHHNWEDSLSATTHDGLTLHWKLSFDIMGGSGFTHEVWVTDEGGATLLEKTVVVEKTEEVGE